MLRGPFATVCTHPSKAKRGEVGASAASAWSMACCGGSELVEEEQLRVEARPHHDPFATVECPVVITLYLARARHVVPAGEPRFGVPWFDDPLLVKQQWTASSQIR